jgi:uncharacterized protein YjbJ (UPF0337 family)
MGDITLGAASLAQRMNIQRVKRRIIMKRVGIVIGTVILRVVVLNRKDISISRRSHKIIMNQSNSTKPQTSRRDIMKSGTRDQAEGKLHQAKGKIKEIAGKVSMDPDLEAAGKDENLDGKIQEKMGQVKKLVGK